MKPRKLAFGVCLGMALVSSAAVASSWEGTSGVTNEHKQEVFAPPGTALRKVVVREQSDKPYLVAAYFYRTSTGAFSSGKSMASNDESAIGTFQTGEVDLGTGSYATAIQVCTNKNADDSKERIKGLRLWGATVNADGSLAQNGTPHEFKHANCSEWHTKVSCDSRSVITSVRGYYGDRGFSGLQISCARPGT